MLPGVLAGIAACVMSGREDWLQLVTSIGLFGALGWGFGGSFSYMKVVGYTHSGHLPSVLFRFFGLFLGSFLWAALGGACTAYAAAEDQERLAAYWCLVTVALLSHRTLTSKIQSFCEMSHRRKPPVAVIIVTRSTLRTN